MLRTGHHPVDSAIKIADLLAAGDETDRIEQRQIVQKEEQGGSGHRVVERELRPEVAERRAVPRCLLYSPLDFLQQHGLEKSFQHHTMIGGEAIAEDIELSVEIQALPG